MILAKVFEINDLNKNNLVINCARGTKIIADRAFDDCKDESWEVIILPGRKLGALIIESFFEKLRSHLLRSADFSNVLFIR